MDETEDQKAPGRPRLADPDRRVRRLDVHLTDAEWALVHQAAGLIPVRTWARNEIVKAAQRATKKPVEITPEAIDLLDNW